jgi:hypothetical protein
MLSMGDSLLGTNVFLSRGNAFETQAVQPWITQLRCDYVQLKPLSGTAVGIGIAYDPYDDHTSLVTVGFFHGQKLTVPYAYLSVTLEFVSAESQQRVSRPPEATQYFKPYEWRTHA